jgi:hypothetical protein
MSRRKNCFNALFKAWQKGDDSSEAFRAINADTLAGNTNSKQKCCGQPTSEATPELVPALVNIDCPVLVRITRFVPYNKQLDDDNCSGGAKQLRDAIASIMGRKGDSAEDGMHWEYCQEQGPEETKIEIFEHESSGVNENESRT